MQKYKPKTPLAAAGDHLFRAIAACGAGIAWFTCLWGLSLPSLCAGIALGGLLWLCVRQFGKMSTQRREKQMRRQIGGELALAKLLLMPPRRAAFQAALWVAPRIPLIMHKAGDWEITGTWNEKPALLRLISQHESMPVTAQQMVECLRRMHACQAETCIVCATAPLSREAAAFAADASPPIHVISRAEMIDLAGLSRPATDEDLRNLAQRRRQKRSLHEWLNIILEPGRTRRYFWYGTGLGLLAWATRSPFYPLPSLICLLLFALSRMRVLFSERRRRSTA